MSAEKVTQTLLNASAELVALVGTRIYLDTRPEADPLPAVTYETISDRQDSTEQSGKEKVTARVQVNCMGNTAESAHAVREAARKAMHKAGGTIGGIQVVQIVNDGAHGDSYDPLVDIYTKPVDFIIHYLR